MPSGLHRLEPGAPVDLVAHDPADTGAGPGGKADTTDAFEELTGRLADLQDMLYAESARSVLVVLQGLDTAGKGGTIKRVFSAVNPSGVRVVSFKAPSHAELAHDFLWRVHAEVPPAGTIGVFDRSHYEDVLVVRVEDLVPEARWQKRYDHIVDFERLLADEGTTVVKIFLHISRDEQRERLQARLDKPAKRWKYRAEDLRTRERWDDYQAAFAEALERTGTAHAPWHVVPADKKWYRNWAVASIVTGALEDMDLSFPDHPDLDGIVVR